MCYADIGIVVAMRKRRVRTIRDYFTYIHFHSDLSNGVTNVDSITKYDDYIAKAKECGMKAMAFTEHGSVFSWVNKKRHIEAAGMKYIHGEEFYVTETLGEKIRDNYHVCLYARNYKGVLELNQLSSESFNRSDNHFYYAPRISIDQLIRTSDNILVSTACLGGILHNGTDTIKDKFIAFLAKNKHRCFLEIQHHNVEEQKLYNQYLYKLSKSIGVPLIAGTDTHALNKEHLEGRRMLQKAKGVGFANENAWDLVFKCSVKEFMDAFVLQNAVPKNVARAAIEETNVFADMIEEFELDESYKYPHLWADSDRLFLEKIRQGIIRRGVDKYPNYQEYLDRIDYELAAYRHNGAIDFMLLMEDILGWCTQNDIQVGYGRGSVNGSVIAWLLGITEMDSIKHGLNFDRFMSTERVSLSDIDTDFPPSRIDDVKKYIFSKTGLYCCDIVTFNTIALKGAIRDICRAFYVENLENQSEDVLAEIKKCENSLSPDAVLPDALIEKIERNSIHPEIPYDYMKRTNEICSLVDEDEEKARKLYPKLFEYVDLVNGTIVSVGSHPCGLTCSPHSVTDHIGTFTTSTSEYPISQIYMKEIDGLNYVKLDLLRLDTIEIINETCKLAGIERVTPDNLDITDVNVWNSMRDDTTQIFQWEGETGNNYIKKLLSDENIKKFQKIDKNVDRMTLLSIGNSAIRPAGASYRDDLANGVVRKSGSKAIDEFLKPTFGYLVFQCQIINFLHEYCGFTMGEADVVRRHFSKKQFTKDGIAMTELDTPIIKNGGYMVDKDGVPKKDHYINGFVATMKEKFGMPKEEAEQTIVAFLQVIIDASRYLFSLNHSQPYSFEGYASGWLRYYYPLQFITVALNVNQSKEEKTIALTNYAKKVGIEIRSPKFRYSKAEYFCDTNDFCIYKGIGSIKYMNAQIANELYDLRNEKFADFIDVLVAISHTSVNSRQLDILIKLNYFEEFGEIKRLLECTKLFNNLYSKKQFKKDKLQSMNLEEMDVRQFAAKETEKMFSGVDTYHLLKYMTAIMKYPETTLVDKIHYQQELLGYIDIKDARYKGVGYVMSVDKKYAPKLKIYALANGNTVECKVDKKTFNCNQVATGNFVRIEGQRYKPQLRRLDSGDYEEIPGKKILWLTKYKKVDL